MLIKGIRSFSPDNETSIEFSHPLTLIVGDNGAGKTTIIECLRMACTGEFPPGTRAGQGFVHDPRVAGETEVKAQIRLRFRSVSRQPMMVVRSFQLTQKRGGTSTFKALDNALQTLDGSSGQRETLSYRCGDMDRIVPGLLGVSSAVLTSVIFVHQDDSLWPMGEAGAVKRRFDELFAATKYTKALETLKKLRQEKQADIRVARAHAELLQSHASGAARLGADL
ncbi:hypothetical protein H632_c703p0, partial [Helicosporidium sp. ATCC 50920]